MKIISSIQAKGYSEAGASRTKRSLKGFIAQSSAPFEDIDFNNATMRQRGRMLYMATPVAAAAINTNRTKIVGSGLHVKPTVNREILSGIPEEQIVAWEKYTEAEWKMWAEQKKNCDATGVNNFYEIQQLAVKNWLMSGDVFAVLQHRDKTPLNPYGLRIRLVEADRVSTPFTGTEGTRYYSAYTEGKTKSGNRIHDGVEVDKYGRVVAYHISNVYPNSTFRLDEQIAWTRVPADGARTGMPNVLQVMDAERPDQYRGVTYLAPVIETILQLRRYTESELIAALVQSYLTAWITTSADSTNNPFNEAVDGDIEGQEHGGQISHSENE